MIEINDSVMVYFNSTTSLKPSVIHGIVDRRPVATGDMWSIRATQPAGLGVMEINPMSSSLEAIVKEKAE